MENKPEPMEYEESGKSDYFALQNNAGSQHQDQFQHQSVINTQPLPTDGSVSQTSISGNLTYQQYPHSRQNQQSESPPPVNQHPLAGQNQQPESGSPPLVNQHPLAGQNQQSESGSPPLVNQDHDKTGSDIGKPDNGTAHPAPSDTAPNMPTEDVTGATNKIGKQPSAPLDTAKFNIRVEWSALFTERWRASLQKALQSWFSLLKDKKEEYNIVNLQLLPDQNLAAVEVAPSTALDIVKEAKTATLTFKELNQSAVVHFLLDNIKPVNVPLNQYLPVDKKEKVLMPQVDMFVNAVIDLDKWSQEVQTKLLKRMKKYKAGNKLSFSGSLVEVERSYREVCEIVGGPEAEMDTDAVRNDPSDEIPQNSGTSGAQSGFITPLHQYWYFSHAYKKEINQIQEKFGVKIDAEVSVSVTAEDQTTPESVRKAIDTLMDLYQTSTTSLQSVTIPQTQLDSDTVKDVMRNIQSDQAKMALMMSVDGCMLSGPKNTISRVQSRLNSESGQEFGTSVGSGLANKMETDSSFTSGTYTLEMDIKDTPDPIVMSDALWKLMNKTSRKQFAGIENKYGVHIFNKPLQDSTEVKVMIKSKDNVLVNLESHAQRSFIHLYQKISMSSITCPLSSPLDEKNLKNELDGHRLVVVDEKIGIWKLIGLPRNLGPAIADLEKLVGKPVFDDNTKKLIDYSEKSQKFRRHNWKHLEGESSSAIGPGSSVYPDTSTKEDIEKSKDDDCPICMEKFTNEVKLKCGHGFCRECLKRSEKSLGQICLVCKKIYGKLRGNQPKGKMTYSIYSSDLPGYPRCDTTEITYDIPSGIQAVEMFVNAVIDLDKWSQEVQTKLLKKMGKYKAGNKLSFSGSLIEVERFYREVCEIVGGSEAEMDTDAVRNDPSDEIPQNSGTSGAPPAFITPLHQYWYFSHAYKKEINQIQDKFGVKIDAEVSVSVTAEDQTTPDSVRKAKDTLMDLYQTSTTSLQSVTILQTQLDSDIVKNVVRNIQSDQAKMALMMSVDGCMLSGQKNIISRVQSRLNSESGQEFGTSVGSGLANKMETDSSFTSGTYTLEMDIKDTPDPIVMSDALWKLMNKTSRKQFAGIENKYGVHIFNQPLQDSTEVKVMIKSKDNVLVNLESHAHRAFIHLYQKISMSAITCPLSSPLDEKNLKNELDGHRLVGVDEKIGIWKLIGLPRNLGPAIADLEKLVGKPVFDDNTKKLIDYSETSQKFRRHNWKHLEGESSSAIGPGSSVYPDTSTKEENEQSKDDDCLICMEKFTNEVKLKCGHGFCREYLKRSEKSLGQICLVCKKIYGKLRGNQPKGKMTYITYRSELPGYPGCGTIVITYDIPSGIQTDEHPNPGQPYNGAQHQAFLPNNAEGKEVLQLLQRAFDQRLIFTVGTSTTTGADNTVTWNDIHHKICIYGGPQSYGYPDPDYLKRVKDELKAKGIE